MFEDRKRGRAVRLAACCSLLVLLSAAMAALAAPTAAPALDSRAAFESLKKLAGAWQGTAGEMPDARVQYRVASGGSVVMETLFPGTPHEMISMYHMDGDNLMMTHYCSLGNQPQMKLDIGQSSAKHLDFVFTGGTNMNADKDLHIHAVSFDFVDADHVETTWTSYADGKQKDVKIFKMARMKD